MDRYTNINSSIWTDDAFYELGHTERELYFYILTSPFNNIAGFYRLPVRQIASDTKYEEKEILPMLVGQNKLWKYDENTKQVLIPNYLKYNKVASGSQLKAVKGAIKPLTICELHAHFLNRVAKYSGIKSWKFFEKDMVAETIAMYGDGNDDYCIELTNNYKEYISILVAEQNSAEQYST